MLKHYLTVALRTLRRDRAYALLNVAGLAVGLACCLLIGLYVLDELRFDRFHDAADQTFRVVEVRSTPDLGDVRGRTTNGGLNVRLAGDRWDGERLDVETTNGGVKLVAPDGYSADLETGTTNGGAVVERG